MMTCEKLILTQFYFIAPGNARGEAGGEGAETEDKVLCEPHPDAQIS